MISFGLFWSWRFFGFYSICIFFKRKRRSQGGKEEGGQGQPRSERSDDLDVSFNLLTRHPPPFDDCLCATPERACESSTFLPNRGRRFYFSFFVKRWSPKKEREGER